MQEKVHFTFFILCTILSQGILGKFLEKDVEESSKLLVRQKRVIDRRPGEEILLTNGDIPYVANLRHNSHLSCMVTILSQHTAITAARCVAHGAALTLYKIYSGSAYSQRGNVHNVTSIRMRGNNPSRTVLFVTGVALITVDPPFEFNRNTGRIGLHSEPVLAGMEGIVAGWGYRVGTGPVETAQVKRLRVISVSVINHRDCKNIYSGTFPITDEDVCTYHPQKLCADADAGAPLVIDNQLVGIYTGRIHIRNNECPIKPDVFVLLQNLNYGPWIMRNIVP